MPPRRRRNVNDIQGQGHAQGGDAEIPPDLVTIIAQAVAAGVATALQNQQPPQQPQQMAQVPLPMEQPNSWERVRNSFTKGNPPEFSGSTEVTEAYQWRKDIERHLRMVTCTEVQKQMLATFKLVGNALQWWESMTTPEQRITFTYTDFQVRFDAKYFPYAVRAAKKKEFLELQQGDKTVVAYEQEFTNLTLFAPEEVDTEEKKLRCFVNGLIWPIRQVLLGCPAYTTYAQVVDAALQHCQSRRDHKKGQTENRHDRDFTGQTMGRRNGNGSRHFERGSHSGQQPWKRHRSNGDAQRGGTSTHRKQNGVPQTGQSLPQGNQLGEATSTFRGNCYGCGELGHSVRYCPNTNQAQFGQQGQRKQPPWPAPQVPQIQTQNRPALPAPPLPTGQPTQLMNYGRAYNVMPDHVQAPPQ